MLELQKPSAFLGNYLYVAIKYGILLEKRLVLICSLIDSIEVTASYNQAFSLIRLSVVFYYCNRFKRDTPPPIRSLIWCNCIESLYPHVLPNSGTFSFYYTSSFMSFVFWVSWWFCAFQHNLVVPLLFEREYLAI